MAFQKSRWTTDLLVVLLSTVLATVSVLIDNTGSQLRTVLVLPFVIFLPGYALVSALFPEERRPDSSDNTTVSAPKAGNTSISLAARIGLSVAASIGLLPGVVLALQFVFGEIRVVPSFIVLAVFTAVLTPVALFRRYQLPESERFGVPSVAALVGAVGASFRIRKRSLSRTPTFEPSSRRGLLLNVALAVSIVAFAGSVAAMYAAPTQDEQFTELYLLTESGDGEFVASDYPRNFDGGQSRPVYVGIANHEGASQSYTTVVKLQEVDQTTDGTEVTRETELDRFSRTVEAGETDRIRHDLQPSFGGSRLRVQYLLYRGDAPEDPSAETAYRSTQLWISVDGGSTGGR
ncbi:DUF1616 domain-containing protein [Halobellus captivus]|uniref:DUF1616 domain-containing protein n=1 Tax=Halobellus captivus TaxID=2592614 RepID=UPI00119F506E|nr:DUF1616 domain-containing protein [Halobellus captivus]